MRRELVFWRRITLGSYILLLLHIASWFFVVSPPQNKTFALLSMIYLLILFVPWTQLISNNPRVYMWSGYLILLYFTHAVVESYANTQERGYALLELLLTIVYFIGATMCYRYSRHNRNSD